MKTMTCKQLGGVCDMTFQAETLEEMAELCKTHAMEEAAKGDAAHIAKMEEMKEMMNDEEGMKKWYEDMQGTFDAQPMDQ